MFLQSLASGTGGDAFQTNDRRRRLQACGHAGECVLSARVSQRDAADGKFHQIKVRVKRRGLEVRSRTGYWAPLAVDVEHARTTAAAAEVRPAVAEALASLPPADAPRAIDVLTGTMPLENGRTGVTVAWTARRQASNPENLPVAVSVVATAGREAVFQGPVSIGGTSFEAPPGPLQLAIAMTDAAGEVVDREQRLVQVPDPASTRLALSTPVVFSCTLKESREPRPPVHAGREFERTDLKPICFVASGGSREDAAVTARLLNRAGTALTRLIPAPISSREAITSNCR